MTVSKEVKPITIEDLESGKAQNSGLKVVKHTELSIVGAYAKEKAMENLPKLFEVANAYPNKFFVLAGGNSGEDFREAMQKLKDQRPKNLLIAAEWAKVPAYDYEGPAQVYNKKYELVYGPTYGPDIYVYNEGSKHPSGSSFSVPELSAEIDVLLNKGLSFEQAKDTILASSDNYPKTLADGTEITLKVFNPQLLKTK